MERWKALKIVKIAGKCGGAGGRYLMDFRFFVLSARHYPWKDRMAFL